MKSSVKSFVSKSPKMKKPSKKVSISFKKGKK